MREKYNNIDEYYAAFPNDVQDILRQIQAIGRKYAPNAIERFSYNMPTFFEKRMLFHYAGFRNHFSIFPPLMLENPLDAKLKKYQNEKGNLRFSYNEPIPFELIEEALATHIARIQAKI